MVYSLGEGSWVDSLETLAINWCRLNSPSIYPSQPSPLTDQPLQLSRMKLWKWGWATNGAIISSTAPQGVGACLRCSPNHNNERNVSFEEKAPKWISSQLATTTIIKFKVVFGSQPPIEATVSTIYFPKQPRYPRNLKFTYLRLFCRTARCQDEW